MAVDRRLIRGLGLYPGDSCYDPKKSWLWFNWLASPEEQYCMAVQNAALPKIPMPVAPGVPVTGSSPTGAVTPEQAAAIIAQRDAEAAAASKSQIQKYFEDLAEVWGPATPPPEPEPCGWYQTESKDGTCTVGGVGFWGLLIGGGVLVAVIAAKR